MGLGGSWGGDEDSGVGIWNWFRETMYFDMWLGCSGQPAAARGRRSKREGGPDGAKNMEVWYSHIMVG